MRPVLRPGLCLLRRDATSWQVGLEPGRAVVVEDSIDLSALLATMDGIRREGEVLAAAVAAGADPDAARRLLADLLACGAVEDADELLGALSTLPARARRLLGPQVGALSLLSASLPAGSADPAGGVPGLLQRRRQASIGISGGAGGPARAAAAQLSAAGIGRLAVEDPALAEELELSTWTAVRRWPSTGPVDAVLLAPDPSGGRLEPDRAEADRLLRAGVPHLVAVVHETTARLGPFVLPGSTSCLRCFDLDMAANDPAWPAFVPQLATRTARVPHAPPAVDPTLAALVGVWAALELLAHVGGLNPSTAGATVEVSLTKPSPRRQQRPAHPGCGCRWDRAVTMGA